MITATVAAIVVGTIVGAFLSMVGALEFHRSNNGMKFFLGLLTLACIVIAIYALGGWVAIVSGAMFGLLSGTIFGSAMGR